MKKVLVSNHIPRIAVERLLQEKGISLDYRDEEKPMEHGDLVKRVNGCDGLLCTLVDKIDRQVLENGKDTLKVVSTMTVGYDHIDVSSCKELNICVGNTPGVLTETTAELTISLMLATTRRLPEAANAVKTGEWGSWRTEWMLGKDLFDSVIGIVGFGDIGKAVAKRLVPFQCKKILVSQPRKPSEDALDLGYGARAEYVQFDELLKESDIISVHCPLKDQTKNLFDEKAFAQMKNSSVFINTSRGPVVDQEALYNALSEKRIFAAGLDVTTPEPIPVDHKLLELPNCLILPHIGSATERTRNKMALLAVQNLLAGINGEKLPHEVV